MKSLFCWSEKSEIPDALFERQFQEVCLALKSPKIMYGIFVDVSSSMSFEKCGDDFGQYAAVMSVGLLLIDISMDMFSIILVFITGCNLCCIVFRMAIATPP